MPRKNANKTVRQVSAFPVPQPDLVQAVGDESFPVMDGGAAGLPDGAGQTAGSIEFHLGAELGAEAVGQAVQQPGGAQYKAILETGGCVLPRTEAGAGAERSIWGSWAVFCTREARESCGPGRMAPPTSSCLALTPMMEMAVSAEMTASGRAFRKGSDHAAEKLCTQLGRVVQPQLDAAFQPGPDGQDAGTAEHPQPGQHLPCQGGDHTAQDAALDLGGRDVIKGEQIHQPDGVFICGAGNVGVKPPAEFQTVLFISANRDMGVANVDGQIMGGWPPCLYNVII